MIREIHESCALTSLVFGSAFNIGLVWLILMHTPTELRVYSRILLQTCVLDLLMLAISAIVQPVFYIQLFLKCHVKYRVAQNFVMKVCIIFA